ncbi:MAG: hypothetical protein H0W34_13465 [Pyrinomonadaceae bacterium]|nr:hypothetical protein [Pyrinomonadaceae bacterium]
MREQDKTFANAVLTPFSNANDLARALIDADLQAQVLRWWHFRPQADLWPTSSDDRKWIS